MTRKTLNLLPILFVLLPMQALWADDDLFPLPDALKPDVGFWRDVFTRYENDEGVLHDNRNLAVVYERVAVKESMGRRARQALVAEHRKRLQAALRTLAGGKRTNLSELEAKVLAAWPADVSNATLKSAVSRIRFQQGLRGRFRDGLVRSGRWRETIHNEFSALGVPLAIAALPHVESSYNTDARSHVGASGIWQFTRSTGRRFMRVDHVVDERNDPFTATRAAGQLMAYNYSITGNWPMAITAYNHGLGGVRRAMREFGDTAYVDILRNYKGRTFGFASRNFYVAFLAAMEVDQDPEKFFPGLKRDAALGYGTLTLQDYIPSKEMAKALSVSSAELRRHNLGLQSTVWQGSKYLPKGYVLRFPSDAASLLSAYQSLPDSAVFKEQLPDLFHTVERGDTLSGIAKTYKTQVSTLSALNNLRSENRIRAGQKLRLPAAGPAPVVVARESLQTAPGVATIIEHPAIEPAVVANSEAALEVPSVDNEADLPVEADELDDTVEVGAAAVLDTSDSELLSDPSDYSVAADTSIEVHPLETLGHYGDWLEIKTQRLRDLNGLAFRTPLTVGQKLKLDFGKVSAAQFEARRIEYHRAQQDSFFRDNRITGVTMHRIKPGEAVWILALRQYRVPMWLFRQYNPEVDVHRIRPGTVVQIPLLEKTDVQRAGP